MTDIGQQRCNPSDEFQFGLIDVEFLMVELHEGILVPLGNCLKDLFRFVLVLETTGISIRASGIRRRGRENQTPHVTFPNFSGRAAVNVTVPDSPGG
jgi:hypothetical protein